MAVNREAARILEALVAALVVARVIRLKPLPPFTAREHV